LATANEHYHDWREKLQATWFLWHKQKRRIEHGVIQSGKQALGRTR
jgi:hypothetical protein